MSRIDVLLKLRALDFETLTEESRCAAVAEVRAQVAEISSIHLPGVDMLIRKVAFLKVWQKLERLRVKDVQREVAPPFEISTSERMFAPEVEPVAPEAPLDSDGTETDPSATPVTAPAAKKGVVSVRLVEEGKTKNGKQALGPVIEVTKEHASHLLAENKAVLAKAKASPAETESAEPAV